MREVHLQMIRKFQCPGCVSGPDYDADTVEEQLAGCPHFKPCADGWNMCEGHVLGTMLGIGNNIALGLPKGFNKPGVSDRPERKGRSRNTMDLNLLTKKEMVGELDRLNVPVWALEEDGYLFIRVFSPRINRGWVMIVKGATMADIPKEFSAINVAEFQDEID